MSNTKWNRYTIMHGNRKVACIRRDGSCTVYRRTFMPYDLYLENISDISLDNMDERMNNLQNFYHWCSSRMLTLDRRHAKEILNSIGMRQAVTDRDRAEISISYHCLSLMDIYWVRDFRENIAFEDINLYSHSLSDAFVDVSLCGRALTVENAELISDRDIAGDIGTPGVAPKAWVRRNGTFKLLKDGAIRDVEAELLASKVLDCFNINHVRYYESEYNSIKVSACNIITSPEKSIVTAEAVNIYAINNNTDLLSIASEISYYDYYMMNIADYLIGNNDRHRGNWGFYVDNSTNRFIGLHPLMDFNKAFTAYSDMKGAMCLTGMRGKNQQDAAAEAVRLIGLNQISEVEKQWFKDESTWEMFNARLSYLRNIEKEAFLL